MGQDDNASAGGAQRLNPRQHTLQPGVVSDDTIFHRDIKIQPQKNGLVRNIYLFDKQKGRIHCIFLTWVAVESAASSDNEIALLLQATNFCRQ